MGGGVREKDEDLALFKDIGKQDKMSFLYPSSVDQLIGSSFSTEFGELSHPQCPPPGARKGIGAELLDSDVSKTDYDWLMTPPGTPLFPSLNADSPALQQGALINRSLTAIKTLRVSSGPRSNSPDPNGNPSPRRRPSTSQNSEPRSAGRRSQNHLSAKQASNNRPATPTASPNLQARPSTPTRQNSATGRPVTPLGARPVTTTSRRPGTPTSSGRPSCTPALRRSSSSPTGSQPSAAGSARRNPSPSRSGASTGSSARGVSPVRSESSRGVSPMRGVSPVPARGLTTSPSTRAPYPVEASDCIPPNLRTTSDRPGPAERRAIANGAGPGEGRASGVGIDSVSTQRRTPSPARSAAPSLSVFSQNLDRASRAASSDSKRSFDTYSQSDAANHGIVTSERGGSRGRMFGQRSDDYGRSRSLQKARQSNTSPQFVSSASKKSFESAAREYRRGQVAAFRPLLTNSSISTFYSSRASGLIRRPLTLSSTASSSEHGATVTHNNEVDDEDAGSTCTLSNWQASARAHFPRHLFDKSPCDAENETGTLDDDELSTFFRNPEALRVEVKSLAPVVCDRREEKSQEICNAELNWLSRNEHVDDWEYLWSRDVEDVDINTAHGAAGTTVQGSKQVPSCLDKIKDMLRHLKGTAEHEDEQSASKMHQAKIDADFLYALRALAALDFVVGRDNPVIKPTEQQGTCEVCGHRNQAGGGETSESWTGCYCSTITSGLPFHGAGKVGSARPSLAEVSSSRTMETAESKSKLANMVCDKERDSWYVEHSSEHDVPVAGFSYTKIEIDSPKDVHMRAGASHNHHLSRESQPSPTAVIAQLESSVEREDISLTAYTGKGRQAEKCDPNVQKEHVSQAKASMEVPHDGCLISDLAEGGSIAAGATLKRKELDQEYSEGLEIEAGRRVEIRDHINRRMPSCILEILLDVGAGSKSLPQTWKFSPEGRGEQELKQSFNEPEEANQKALDQQLEDESTQAWSYGNNVCKPPWVTFELPQNPRMPALNSSSVPHHRTVASPGPHSSETEKKREVSGQPNRAIGGYEECGVTYIVHAQASQVLAVNGSHTSALSIAGKNTFSRTESCRPAKMEASEKGLRIMDAPPTADLGSCSEADWNEDHALVMPKVKETWQEEGSQSQIEFEAQQETDVPALADEHERTYLEPGDEVAFIDDSVTSCGRTTDELKVPDAASEHSADERSLDALPSRRFEPQEHYLESHMLTEQNLSGLQVGRLTYNNGEILKQLKSPEVQENISKDPHVLEIRFNTITEHFDTSTGDVWNSMKLPQTEDPADIADAREAQEEKYERAQHGLESAAKIIGDSGKPFRRNGSALQGFLSKSSSSKSSFRTPTSGSSIDLSRSTDTTSSCRSNASWEDPQLYGSKFWDSRSASNVARVSEVSEFAVLPKVVTDSEFEENDDAKSEAHEVVRVRDLLSYSGKLQQSNPEVNVHSHNIVVEKLGASPDEFVSTAEHFDSVYNFECLGSKRGPSLRAAELPIVSKLMPCATISLESTNSANLTIPIATSKSYFGGDSLSTTGTMKVIEASHKDKTLPKSQSIQENITNNSRLADSELPVVMSSSLNSKVSVEAPMKAEEIVESAESPNSATWRHLSSFKCRHKKPANAELKQSNATVSSSSGISKLRMPVGDGQQSGDSGTPGSKTIGNNKLKGKSASPSPHLNNLGRSVKAALPVRPLAVTNASQAPAEPAGDHGEAVLDTSIYSRFSNITVRSGSDTGNSDCGRGSLEETSSRCGSSSGTNSASMAILRSSLPQLGCHEVDAMTNGNDQAEPGASGDDDHDEEQHQQARNFPLLQRTVIQSEAIPCYYDCAINQATVASARIGLNHSALNIRSKPLDAAHHLLQQAGLAVDLDHILSPQTSTAFAVMNPVLRPQASSLNNYAPNQNLDKFGEQMEQSETFGVRVMLRNPQQQFLHSPYHDHSEDYHKSRRLPALEEPHFLAASFNSSTISSSSSLRIDQSGHSANSAVTIRLGKSTTSTNFPNKCLCTIL